MSYWFTGDWHLWHKNILRLANRDFPDIETHNAMIQQRINKLLVRSDHLVILGDLAFGTSGRLAEWLDGLVTKNLHLVRGNHDDAAEQLVRRQPRRFQRVGDILEYDIPATPMRPEFSIVCCHYAMRVWNKSHHGSYHVYGHSHGNLAVDYHSRSMDVGVDTNGFYPWHLNQIVERLDTRDWKPFENHKGIAESSDKALCALCDRIKYEHDVPSLRCPVMQPNGEFTFHRTQYFAPKHEP